MKVGSHDHQVEVHEDHEAVLVVLLFGFDLAESLVGVTKPDLEGGFHEPEVSPGRGLVIGRVETVQQEVVLDITRPPLVKLFGNPV